MTIFNYLEDIVVHKKGNLPLEQYVPFLIGRWLSFINPTIATFINTTNSGVLLENKEMHYKVMITAFPKLARCPRIQYIKKVKEEANEDLHISFLANDLEISKREAKELLEYIA